MTTLTFPAPPALNGDQLSDEISALGFTPVVVDDKTTPIVSLYLDAEGNPDVVQVIAAEFTNGMPPAELRAACADMDEVNGLIAEYQQKADEANAAAAKRIAEVVAKHVPVEVPVPPSPMIAKVDEAIALAKAGDFEHLGELIKEVLA